MKKLGLVLAGLALTLGLFSIAATKVRADCVGSTSDPLACACNQSNTAASNSAVCSGRSGTDPVTGSQSALVKVTNLITVITGVAAVFVIVIAGFQYVVSQGDSAKISRAKDMIIFAVVGLVIAILAQLIVRFVVNKL